MPRDLREVEIDGFLAQAEMLAQLQAHPAWEAFTVLLRDMRQGVLEALARESNVEEFRFSQGVVAALDEILDRPRRVVLDAERIRAAEEENDKVLRPELRATIGLGADHDGEV
jgi:hypothetical protein